MSSVLRLQYAIKRAYDDGLFTRPVNAVNDVLKIVNEHNRTKNDPWMYTKQRYGVVSFDSREIVEPPVVRRRIDNVVPAVAPLQQPNFETGQRQANGTWGLPPAAPAPPVQATISQQPEPRREPFPILNFGPPQPSASGSFPTTTGVNSPPEEFYDAMNVDDATVTSTSGVAEVVNYLRRNQFLRTDFDKGLDRAVHAMQGQRGLYENMKSRYENLQSMVLSEDIRNEDAVMVVVAVLVFEREYFVKSSAPPGDVPYPFEFCVRTMGPLAVWPTNPQYWVQYLFYQWLMNVGVAHKIANFGRINSYLVFGMEKYEGDLQDPKQNESMTKITELGNLDFISYLRIVMTRILTRDNRRILFNKTNLYDMDESQTAAYDESIVPMLERWNAIFAKGDYTKVDQEDYNGLLADLDELSRLADTAAGMNTSLKMVGQSSPNNGGIHLYINRIVAKNYFYPYSQVTR